MEKLDKNKEREIGISLGKLSGYCLYVEPKHQMEELPYMTVVGHVDMYKRNLA